MTIKQIKPRNLEQITERKPCCDKPFKGNYVTSLVIQSKVWDIYKCLSCNKPGIFELVDKPKSQLGDGEYYDG